MFKAPINLQHIQSFHMNENEKNKSPKNRERRIEPAQQQQDVGTHEKEEKI